MTTDNKKEMIEKVKKLLAMAERQDGNENEAAVAAAQAAKLLSKYNLSLVDVSVEEVVDIEFETTQNKPQPWVSSLVGAVAQSFGCDMYLSLRLKRDGDGLIIYKNRQPIKIAKIMFVGTEVDIQIAYYVAIYLQRTVIRMAVEYSKTLPKEERRMGRKSYRLGVVDTLREKLQEYNSEQNVEAETETNVAGMTGTEIIHIKKDMLEKHMDKKFFAKERKSRSFTISTSCFDKGTIDGKDINIHKGVNGGDNQKTISG